MIVTDDYVKQEIQSLWPDLSKDRFWARNQKYVLPSLNELQTSAANCPVDLPIIMGFSECELFALGLQYKIKKQWVLSEPQEQYPWAFGDFIALKQTMLGQTVHTACFCLTSDAGIQIIEPMQQNSIKAADTEKYELFFINLM